MEYYYHLQYNVNPLGQITPQGPSSLSAMAAESLTQLQQHQIQAQTNPKYFNYYATIRRDIFEFLLRIRSNKQGKVLLINRLNRRKYQESKYLILSLW